MFLFSVFHPARPSGPSVGHKGGENSGNSVCTLAVLSLGRQTKARTVLFSRKHLGSQGVKRRCTVQLTFVFQLWSKQ